MKNKRLIANFWSGLEAIPLIIPAAFAGLGIVIISLLLAGRLTNALFWPLGLAVMVLMSWVVVKYSHIKDRPGSVRERHWFDALVMLGVALWIGVNLFFTSHSVFITRDPGIYAVTGQWLISHQDTNIETPKITSYTQGVYNQSSGEWKDYKSKDPERLQPQGMHFFHALLGLAGRVGGEVALFKVNVVFGGFALLAIYAFARLLMKPRWAAVATAALSVTLPMIYFARDTYTEPLAATLTFGALALLWAAQTRPKKDRSLFLWLIAGLTAGAGALTRPDGYLTVVAIAMFLFIMMAVATRKDRRDAVIKSVVFAAGAAVPMILAYVDMTELTSSYYFSHGKDVKIQLAMLAMVLVGGVIGLAICWHTKILRWLDGKTISWRGYAVAAVIIIAALGLMSRPLWLKTHGSTGHSAIAYTMSLQSKLGENIEPRFYSENTVEWLGWYVGMPVVALGFSGLALAGYQAMKDKKLLLLPGLAVVLLTMAVYLINPRITPDQIWAVRRFVPVIIPGIVIFAALAAQKLSEKLFEGMDKWAPVFSVPLALFFVMLPALVSRPFFFVREKANDLKAVEAFCEQLPKNSLVVWLGGSLELDTSMTTRAFCGQQSIGYSYQVSKLYKKTGQIDKDVLARVYRDATAKGYHVVVAIHGSQKPNLLPTDATGFKAVAVYQDREVEKTLLNPPREANTTVDSIELGQLQPDGSVSQL